MTIIKTIDLLTIIKRKICMTTAYHQLTGSYHQHLSNIKDIFQVAWFNCSKSNKNLKQTTTPKLTYK